jgi:glycopeptide antibiotics resistance protein
MMAVDSFHLQFDVDDAWINLLKTLLVTVYVAYFGSRGAEKITNIKK